MIRSMCRALISRTMRNMLVIAGCVIAVAAAVLLSRNAVKDSRQRVQAADRRIDSLEQAYAAAKTRAYAAQYVSKEAEQKERAVATRLSYTLGQARESSEYAKAILDDSSAGMERVKDALYITRIQLDSVTAQASAHLEAVDSMRSAHAAERRTMAVVISDADSIIAVQKALIAVLRADRCRILTLPCPTRKQAFIAGVVLAAGVVLR